MSALVPIAPKLAKLIPLLSSDKEGEVLATVRAILRALDREGLTIHDLAALVTAPPVGRREDATPHRDHRETPSLRVMAETLVDHPNLNDWEADFVASILDMLRRRRHLSVKQKATLHGIWREVFDAE
nr:hypothetical protein 5 [Rhodospirillaceae bacterium]